MFRFLSVTEPDVLPQRNGKLVQWFRYGLFAANTTPSAEGVVGTSLALNTSTVTATVEEYSDFITLSSLLEETAIDPIAQNAAEQLGYRAGLSVDTIVRTEFDSNTGANLTPLGASFSVADARHAKALLRGINVMPRDGGDFVGIIHPYITFDLQSDNTAGGFIDALKYARPDGLLNGEVGRAAGVRFVESTNVGTSGTAPNVLYNSYIVGKGGVGAVDLAGRGPSKVMDPSRQAFRVNVIRGGPQIADPEGKIGSAVSYRFVFVAQTLDSTNLRYRIVQADASIV
jgi:N4-gp56 family major capsid protein